MEKFNQIDLNMSVTGFKNQKDMQRFWEKILAIMIDLKIQEEKQSKKINFSYFLRKHND